MILFLLVGNAHIRFTLVPDGPTNGKFEQGNNHSIPKIPSLKSVQSKFVGLGGQAFLQHGCTRPSLDRGSAPTALKHPLRTTRFLKQFSPVQPADCTKITV